ncbi:MAG TPA: DUF6477 family protein [Paracoccaceae bacterium]|nr:DUF6477 family protein [Paracoccaceae bacterium]
MTDPRSLIAALRRPRLLVRAARAGKRAYVRELHLAPLAPQADPRRDPVGAIARLKQVEEACESARRSRAADYSPGSHISVLAALLAEVELMVRPA